MTPTVANVLSVYSAADASQLREGLAWYLDAHRFARALDQNSPARSAGVIAALSPMMGWETNKMQAARVFERGSADGLGIKGNCAKAQAIFDGADPLDVLGGNKVRAFFATILDPTGDISPVIDRHAFDIAVGKVTDDKSRGILSRKGVYERFADVYRHAALDAGIGAAQMQAVTWITWRANKN